MNISKYENFSGAAHHMKIFSKIPEMPLIPTIAGMPSLHEEPSGSKDGRREYEKLLSSLIAAWMLMRIPFN